MPESTLKKERRMRNKARIHRHRLRRSILIAFVLSIAGHLFPGIDSLPAQPRPETILKHPCTSSADTLAGRIVAEYGSVFAAEGSVKVPSTCVFGSEEEVSRFHGTLKTKTAVIGGATIELQQAAMDALQNAVTEASSRRLRITPLDGEIAGKRSFADTVRIWNSRFEPALDHWVKRGRIQREDADRVRKMAVLNQLRQVLAWEAKGFYFSTGKNRPVMSSVAPPGTSQHLSLLAFDIEQAGSRAVREIMNRNGWFQTVINDSPHFTYLGVPEAELPKRGLRAAVRGGYTYWVPVL